MAGGGSGVFAKEAETRLPSSPKTFFTATFSIRPRLLPFALRREALGGTRVPDRRRDGAFVVIVAGMIAKFSLPDLYMETLTAGFLTSENKIGSGAASVRRASSRRIDGTIELSREFRAEKFCRKSKPPSNASARSSRDSSPPKRRRHNRDCTARHTLRQILGEPTIA